MFSLLPVATLLSMRASDLANVHFISRLARAQTLCIKVDTVTVLQYLLLQHICCLSCWPLQNVESTLSDRIRISDFVQSLRKRALFINFIRDIICIS